MTIAKVAAYILMYAATIHNFSKDHNLLLPNQKIGGIDTNLGKLLHDYGQKSLFVQGFLFATQLHANFTHQKWPSCFLIQYSLSLSLVDG